MVPTESPKSSSPIGYETELCTVDYLTHLFMLIRRFGAPLIAEASACFITGSMAYGCICDGA